MDWDHLAGINAFYEVPSMSKLYKQLITLGIWMPMARDRLSAPQSPAKKSRAVALYATMSALVVVLSVLSIPLPPPLAYFSFVPILIFFIGITLKPFKAFMMCSIGAVLGELLADIIFGYAAYLWLYLPGAFVARGLEGLILSLLEKHLVRGRELPPRSKYRREACIITIGGIWEFFGYALVGAFGYYLAFGTDFLATFISYLWVLIDLTLIPAGIFVVYGVRQYFKQDYFDQLLFNDSP
ncbi:MAG: ECF transporter S component [Candidatus Lokiarchaeota archaeon]|nr:ECF transporter S component [Candidatus Lokiarchaeota archaeon]